MFSVTPDDFAKAHFLGKDSVLTNAIEEMRQTVDAEIKKHLQHIQNTKQALACIYVNLRTFEAKHPTPIFDDAHLAVVKMLQEAGFDASKALISGEDRDQAIRITLPLSASK